jgi:hypothetical protein
MPNIATTIQTLQRSDEHQHFDFSGRHEMNDKSGSDDDRNGNDPVSQPLTRKKAKAKYRCDN